MTDSSLIPSAFLPVGHDCLCGTAVATHTGRMDDEPQVRRGRGVWASFWKTIYLNVIQAGTNRSVRSKVCLYVFGATMFPGDKSTPWEVHFPFEWCKICKEHTLAGCFRLTAASAADSRPVLEGMADGMKCSVIREGFGLELLLLQIERIQMRWPGTQKGPRMDAWMNNYLLIIKTKKIIHQTHISSL